LPNDLPNKKKEKIQERKEQLLLSKACASRSGFVKSSTLSLQSLSLPIAASLEMVIPSNRLCIFSQMMLAEIISRCSHPAKKKKKKMRTKQRHNPLFSKPLQITTTFSAGNLVKNSLICATTKFKGTKLNMCTVQNTDFLSVAIRKS
jgi:hypothetical protein